MDIARHIAAGPDRLRAEAERTVGNAYLLLLRKGFPWLRFPSRIEDEFNADHFAARKRLLLTSALPSIFAFVLACLFDAQLMPDIPRVVEQVHFVVTTLLFLSLVPMFLSQRTWQLEGTYAVVASFSVLISLWGISQSTALTAYAHAAVAILFVCSAAIAARLRFWYSLGVGLVAMLGYLLMMHGQTPMDQAIVNDNAEILIAGTIFTLFANYLIEYRERRAYLLGRLDALQKVALEGTRQRLHDLAMLDPLTGLHNRRQFEQDFSDAWSLAERRQEAIGILLVDVDYFKPYNDGYGHLAGDVCLQRLALILLRLAESHGGEAARFGGEEFAILLPGCELEATFAVAEELCALVRQAEIPHDYSPIAKNLTVSVGAATVLVDASADAVQRRDVAARMIAVADQGLYVAKAAGRNRAAQACGSYLMPASAVLQPRTLPEAVGDPLPAASTAAAVPPPPPEVEANDPELAQLNEVLGHQATRLKFPADVEAAYQAEREPERRRVLTRSWLIGAALYGAFTAHDISLFPDIVNVGRISLAAVVALLLLMTGMFGLVRFKTPVLDGISSAGSMIAAMVLIWVMSLSQTMLSYTHLVVLILVLMQVAVGLRLPFRHALLVSYAVLAFYVGLRRGDGYQQHLIEIDVTFIVFIAGQFTIMAAYQLERSERTDYLLARIEARQRAQLIEAADRLRTLSALDPLTGIANRRQFDQALKLAWRRAREVQRPLAVLIIDVDHFKRYNDGYGHPAGDACLRDIAKVLHRMANTGAGVAARLGGEEFAILLEEMAPDVALSFGDLVCAAVHAESMPHRYSGVCPRVTVSVGAAACIPGESDVPLQLLKAADEALYRAKAFGRNRAVGCAGPECVDAVVETIDEGIRESSAGNDAQVDALDDSSPRSAAG